MFFKKNTFLKQITLKIILLSLIFNISACTGFANPASIDEQVNISVYENTTPSIVSVDVDIEDGVSSGTGCIVNSGGIILTSSHILEGAGKIDITLANGEKYPGKLLATIAENNDLALIKITVPHALQVIKLGDSTQIKVGQRVLAIGNPFGFNGTLTTGIISRIDYKRQKIQTDAAINPGSSGGPLLNSNGEVIGISQSIYNPDNNKSNIGIGFAVPVNAAKRFISKTMNQTYPASTKNEK